MLGAVWFDATVRRLPVGSPRTGCGTRFSDDSEPARRLGCCWVLCGSTQGRLSGTRVAHHEPGGDRPTASDLVGWSCGSTRAAGYGAPAHHERGGAGGLRVGCWGLCGSAQGRLGCSETWLAGCVVRHGLPGTPTGSPRTGWGRRRGCAEDRLGGLGLGGVWFEDSPDSEPAHHERGEGPASLGGYVRGMGNSSDPVFLGDSDDVARDQLEVADCAEGEMSGRPSGVHHERGARQGSTGCGQRTTDPVFLGSGKVDTWLAKVDTFRPRVDTFRPGVDTFGGRLNTCPPLRPMRPRRRRTGCGSCEGAFGRGVVGGA